MKSFTVFLLLSLALPNGVASAQNQASQPKLSYQEVFESVWKTVDTNFYDPDFAGVNWQAVHKRYRPQVQQVTNETVFLDLMTKMLKELPVSHLRIIAGSAPNSAASINAKIRLIEGQAVITEIPLMSGARRQGLRVGDVIQGPLNQIAVQGTTAALRVKGCDGRERQLSVGREPVFAERPAVQWQKSEVQPGRRVGYLRVAHFDENTVQQFDAAMADLENTSGLIIDLRDNTGGTNSFIRLASYFVPGQQLVGGLVTRPFLSRHKGQRIDPTTLPKSVGVYSLNALLFSMSMNGAIGMYSEDLGNKTYRGKTVILTNGATASAAEAFIAYMRDTARAKVVGRMTAGQLLTSNTFSLPNGWQIVVPIAVPIAPDGKWFQDTPLAPDFEVKWTQPDVCDGQDPDIIKALEVLSLDSR